MIFFEHMQINYSSSRYSSLHCFTSLYKTEKIPRRIDSGHAGNAFVWKFYVFIRLAIKQKITGGIICGLRFFELKT